MVRPLFLRGANLFGASKVVGPKTEIADWNSPGRIASSARWERESSHMGRAVTQAAVDVAFPAPGVRILDLACGSGAPSIPLAKLVQPGGLVVGLDLSQEPLKVSSRRALERGLANVCYLRADAQKLPFADRQFDRVVSRHGVMFFPDVELAFREAARVLRPGGTIGIITWGPFEQPYFAATAAIVMRHVGMPLPPGAEPMFRFADPESLARPLRQAGFEYVSAERRELEWVWPGSVEDLWAYFQEVTVPMKPLFAAIRPEQRAAIDREVLAALGKYSDGSRVNLTALTSVAAGTKR